MDRRSATVLMMLVMTLTSLHADVGYPAEVAVIANPSVPVDSLSAKDLRNIYTGERRVWSNDEAIVLYDLKEKGAVRDAFYSVLGKSASRMKSLWMKRMLLGEGEPPQSVDTATAIVEKVRTTPGALGFCPPTSVTNDVKVVAKFNVGDN